MRRVKHQKKDAMATNDTESDVTDKEDLCFCSNQMLNYYSIVRIKMDVHRKIIYIDIYFLYMYKLNLFYSRKVLKKVSQN